MAPTDGVKERQGLLHPVDRLVLVQALVVFRDGNEEDNGRNVFEAVDPLLALGSLTSNVKQLVLELADREVRFSDARRLDS